MDSKKQTSRCMFCNSTGYGTGCPYSPHKKHVHIDDSRKCIYCGSPNIGTGCPYNPFSKLHIRGIEYNNMNKESMHHSFTASLFLDRLTQPITSTPAYKLGLVDDEGKVINECKTDLEKAALTPLDMYIFKIKRLVGENLIELLKSNVLLEMTSNTEEKFDACKYQEEVKITHRVNHIIDDLDEVFNESIEKGFSRNHIENIIIESILKKYDKTNID